MNVIYIINFISHIILSQWTERQMVPFWAESELQWNGNIAVCGKQMMGWNTKPSYIRTYNKQALICMSTQTGTLKCFVRLFASLAKNALAHLHLELKQLPVLWFPYKLCFILLMVSVKMNGNRKVCQGCYWEFPAA